MNAKYASVNFWRENYRLPGGLAGHWREKIVYKITTRFRFLAHSALFFLRSDIMSMLLLKVKRNQAWSIAEEKDFLLFCKEKAITDLLDKCVTSAGVSRPF